MSKKALLGGLLPFISSPPVLAAVAIGAVSMTLYEIFSENNEKQEGGPKPLPNGSTPLIEPLNTEVETVEATAVEPSEPIEVTVPGAVQTTVQELQDRSLSPSINDKQHPAEPEINKDSKKEMIRQAMSELGKRSAAARAQKKKLRSQ